MNVKYLARMIAAGALLLVASSRYAHAAENCTAASLKGSFGFVFKGVIAGPSLRIAIVGIAAFDGNGRWSRVETVSFNGQIVPAESVTGTYTVNADCSGNTTDGQGHTSKFVVVGNGEEVLGMSTDNGTVATITMKKQSRGVAD